MSYHDPVLLKESIEALAVQRDGVYIDATFGGGGHSRLILERLGPEGHLLAFDQDEDALANLPDDDRFIFNHHNFRFLKRFLRLHGFLQVDGILADLGVSSHQLDTAERGFSYRFDAELDMRMNRQLERTAADVVNSYSAVGLQEVFSRYGELRNARTLAQQLVDARSARPLRTVGDLVGVAEKLIRGPRHRYLAQLFQALRMEVNDELGALRELLEASLEMLKPGGRLVVIAYHSIEDRLVKQFLKTGNVDGEVQRDDYGNIFRPFRILTKKALTPPAAEIDRNPRARSARLRVGERIQSDG
ncbi:MAG: 16S rRNA (cytosine(1402)-N(4))-methyltransferase RsmH [Saprospiraceae bacterium]|nr:16S rRNA (cytosine(1402)-N(4))-methyltransferase RsmH [Saprospiraceae bacterium]MCB0626320.1 16S rRNA (cytosine(1402)-N(4))-methyltransferase RsmH [Saprospiraceae bacterium]MCB0678482.1 16S rRNA (cytosine(1402)-N(4))-methyltransferase RsmH [Saprospiraceae bacterium]MCB0680134.1 16S rRNA (cytosine(1402)-N(4))-methyltransferase RsmH [Saprospiraceae bacterium]